MIFYSHSYFLRKRHFIWQVKGNRIKIAILRYMRLDSGLQLVQDAEAAPSRTQIIEYQGYFCQRHRRFNLNFSDLTCIVFSFKVFEVGLLLHFRKIRQGCDSSAFSTSAKAENFWSPYCGCSSYSPTKADHQALHMNPSQDKVVVFIPVPTKEVMKFNKIYTSSVNKIGKSNLVRINDTLSNNRNN